MFSYWAYILLGENNTGKTKFQQYLVKYLCGRTYQRLRLNKLLEINHPRAPKELAHIFTANRSFQEVSEYRSVKNYFNQYFEYADVCVLASHTRGSAADDVAQMIEQLKRRCYNVAAVFMSNGYDDDARKIALLPWHEILWIENSSVTGKARIERQLDQIAMRFSEFLVTRAQIW